VGEVEEEREREREREEKILCQREKERRSKKVERVVFFEKKGVPR
jgi:hypothetical protein